MANFTIINAAKCVKPLLLSVTQEGNNVIVMWDNTNISYGAIINLDYSLNGGASWTSVAGNLTTGSDVVTTLAFKSFTIGSTVSFRLSSKATDCNTISNLVTDVVWQGNDNIYITDYVKLEDGTTTYKLHVENVDFNGIVTSTIKAQTNVKRSDANGTNMRNMTSVGIPPLYNTDVEDFTDTVYIPIGVYDCTIRLSVIAQNISNYAEAQCSISYGTGGTLQRTAEGLCAIGVRE